MGTENDLPGISLKDEQRQLQNIIGIAQDNLDRAKESVKKLTDDLEDLRDVYEAQDKEGLALWNNATAQLHENERNIVRCEKARKKPYFGPSRIALKPEQLTNKAENEKLDLSAFVKKDRENRKKEQPPSQSLPIRIRLNSRQRYTSCKGTFKGQVCGKMAQKR